MEIIHLSINSQFKVQDAVCALGFFDGVHLGHQQLLKKVDDISKEKGLKKAIMTFSIHPKQILEKRDYAYLMSLSEKIKILKEWKFDYFYIIDFDQEVARLEPDIFLKKYIINHCIKHVVCGFDFHFGNKGKGDISTLANNSFFDVTVVDEYTENSLKVSSSYIKSLLNDGYIEKANHLLTRPYRVSGEVVYGLQNGRKIGFPTANINYGHYVVLKKGVYGVYLIVHGKRYKGMANIGYNPTVGVIHNLSLEVNIFNFDQNIYGESVDVDFIFRVRDECKFESLNHLKEQLEKDKKHIDQFLD